MINIQTIDELVQRLAALLPPDLKETHADITANFRSALHEGLREFDLVTREEFEIQRSALLHTREKIEDLESQVVALENLLESAITHSRLQH